MLYIPFLDGRIGYDCRACGSKCCRMGNLLVAEGERRAITRAHPRLALFAGDPVGELGTFGKLDPRCWFLAPTGLCDLEQTLGRSAKPLNCRAHPIYFTRQGELAVVALAPGCHWVLDGSPETGGRIGWPEVEALHVDMGPVGETEVGPWPADVLRQVLVGEAAIRDAAARAASVPDYLAWQLGFSSEILRHGASSDCPPAALATARGYLGEVELAMASVLRVAPETVPASASLDRVFLDFGCVLRLSALGLTPQFGDAAPALSSWRHLYAGVVPLLASLYFYARIADQLGIPGAMSSYNATHQMLVRARDRLFACSRLLHRLGRAAAQEVDRDARLAWASLAARVEAAPTARLADHLLAATAARAPEETMILLDATGRALANAGAAGELGAPGR